MRNVLGLLPNILKPAISSFLALPAVCWTAVVPVAAHAQEASDAFVKWASTRAIPLRTIEPFGDMGDLRPLKSLVGTARVVAIGEPNHGTHEPLAMRNRLIRFFIEEMGFTAVALETGFTESYSLERLAAGGPGDLRGTVRGALSWGFGNFPENEELIQWIREYNADTNHLTKIHFYGIDLSGGDNGAFPKARRGADFAIDLLARNDAAAAKGLREKLEPSLAKFTTGDYASLSAAERAQLDAGFTEISAALERNRTALVSLSSDEDYQWALHSVAVARQVKNVFDASPATPWTGPGIPPDGYGLVTARDAGMTENIRWALERENPKGRLVVFAHNGHVMNSSLTGGIWSAYRQAPPAMGKLLRPLLGHDLVIIGGTSGAKAAEKPHDADPGNFDAALGRSGVPPFVLDLRAAKEDRAAFAWLSEPRSLHANIQTFVTITPADAFDAIYYVENLTATRARKP